MSRNRPRQLAAILGVLALAFSACGPAEPRTQAAAKPASSSAAPTAESTPSSPAPSPSATTDESGTPAVTPSPQGQSASPAPSTTPRPSAKPEPKPKPKPKPKPSKTKAPQPTAKPPASTAKEETGLRSGVYPEHAKTRSSHSRGGLSTNSCLAGYAKSWARSLAEKGGGISHQNLNPILSKCGMSTVGENVAAGQTSAAAVQSDWMNSPGHRDNILKEEFNRMGASVYRSAEGRLYWVVVFGKSR